MNNFYSTCHIHEKLWLKRESISILHNRFASLKINIFDAVEENDFDGKKKQIPHAVVGIKNQNLFSRRRAFSAV